MNSPENARVFEGPSQMLALARLPAHLVLSSSKEGRMRFRWVAFGGGRGNHNGRELPATSFLREERSERGEPSWGSPWGEPRQTNQRRE